MLRQTKSGQTLIETLITVLFIAVSVIALIRFQSYLAFDNSLAQQRADATLIAQSQIETLRDYHVLTNTSGYTSYQSIASSTTTVAGTTTTYTVTSTVTANNNPTYKNIDVVVSWTDRTSTARSIRQITNVASIDPQNSAAVM